MMALVSTPLLFCPELLTARTVQYHYCTLLSTSGARFQPLHGYCTPPSVHTSLLPGKVDNNCESAEGMLIEGVRLSLAVLGQDITKSTFLSCHDQDQRIYYFGQGGQVPTFSVKEDVDALVAFSNSLHHVFM